MEKEANKWVTLNRGEYLVNLENETFKIYVSDDKNVKVNDETYKFDVRKIKEDVYVLNLSGTDFEIKITDSHESKQAASSAKLSSRYQVNVNGSQTQAVVDDQRSMIAQSWLLRKSHISKLTTIYAPMPGLITKVLVHKELNVRRGSILLILEAMKMENEIRTLQDCRIESVSVQPGTTVEKNDELLKIIEL